MKKNNKLTKEEQDVINTFNALKQALGLDKAKAWFKGFILTQKQYTLKIPTIN